MVDMNVNEFNVSTGSLLCLGLPAGLPWCSAARSLCGSKAKCQRVGPLSLEEEEMPTSASAD